MSLLGLLSGGLCSQLSSWVLSLSVYVCVCVCVCVVRDPVKYHQGSVTSPLSGRKLRSLSGLCGVAPSRGWCSQVSPVFLVLSGGGGEEREGRGTKGDRRSVPGFSSWLSAFASSMSEMCRVSMCGRTGGARKKSRTRQDL